MSSTKLSLPKLLTVGLHACMDKLGMHVNYRRFEFDRFKQQLDWSRIPEDRVELTAELFDISRDQARVFIAEAEAIALEEKEDTTAEDLQGVGDPMGRTDRITLYAAVRAFQPAMVLETGTAAGGSACYILAALEKNGKGRLHSIDATPDRTNVGRLIPGNLRERVEIHHGSSLTLLPEIAEKHGPFDLFLHDSRHTYSHMMQEYVLAYRAMTPGGVICSHDVLMTNAWRHFLQKNQITRSGIVKNFGVCCFGQTELVSPGTP